MQKTVLAHILHQMCDKILNTLKIYTGDKLGEG